MRLVRLQLFSWKNGKLLEGRLRRVLNFTLFVAILQVSTCHLCAWGPCADVRRAMALICNAKQATGEGKSGPVETGLTRLVATALLDYTLFGAWCLVDTLLPLLCSTVC